MLLWWGPDLLHLYNDAYRPILRDKHPQSLAAPAAEIWAEVWDVAGPMARSVQNGGPATWTEDLQLFIKSGAMAEETYFTFSYSPVPGDDGQVAGVLNIVQETTAKVQSERQSECCTTLRRGRRMPSRRIRLTGSPPTCSDQRAGSPLRASVCPRQNGRGRAPCGHEQMVGLRGPCEATPCAGRRIHGRRILAVCRRHHVKPGSRRGRLGYALRRDSGRQLGGAARTGHPAAPRLRRPP